MCSLEYEIWREIRQKISSPWIKIYFPQLNNWFPCFSQITVYLKSWIKLINYGNELVQRGHILTKMREQINKLWYRNFLFYHKK